MNILYVLAFSVSVVVSFSTSSSATQVITGNVVPAVDIRYSDGGVKVQSSMPVQITTDGGTITVMPSL